MSVFPFEQPRKSQDKIEVESVFTFNESFKKVARFEVNELTRITRFAQNITLPTVEEMEAYLATLLDLRVRFVNDDLTGAERALSRRVRVPARWSVLLDNIGEAHDFGRNIRFMPRFNVTRTKITFQKPTDADVEVLVETLDNQKMLEITEIFEYLMPEGYTTVVGLPKHHDGSLELMAKTTIENKIKGIDVTNPVYGFLAFVLQAEVISNVMELNILFRTEYSSYDTYEVGFTDYFRQVDSKSQVPDANSGGHGQTHSGKGPGQPSPGEAPPNLGHNGNGAVNSNGNLKD